jgi:hypothetical protein
MPGDVPARAATRLPATPRWRTPVLVGAGAAAASAAVLAWDPGDGGTPLCWTQGVFGVDCPLCGGLRCANALLRGDWLAAADHNVVLAVLLPLTAALWAVWLLRSVRDRPLPRPGFAAPRAWATGAVVVMVAFTLARNSDATPLFTWLGATAS